MTFLAPSIVSDFFSIVCACERDIRLVSVRIIAAILRVGFIVLSLPTFFFSYWSAHFLPAITAQIESGADGERNARAPSKNHIPGSAVIVTRKNSAFLPANRASFTR